jgi:hypothetical protein
MFAASKTDSASDGGYQISRSLRFNSADSAYLNRTPASAGNRRTWTFSTWVKRSQLNSGNAMLATVNGSALNYFAFGTSTGDFLAYAYFDGATDVFGVNTSSTSVFRDVSAWYHIVLAVDTTQATASNRVKIYVNNVEQTGLGGTYPTQNYDTPINNSIPNLIGGGTGSYTAYLADQYMTEINFIDGLQLTPSSFGETNAQTGVWQPKAYSGSYGTNGFYLNFSDNSNTTAATLGKDYSGNGNNWTPNGFLVSAGVNNDSLVDSPTSYGVDTGVGGSVRGNYCTINPLAKLNWQSQSGTLTPYNGNLQFDGSSAGAMMDSTIAVRSGKWYWEITQVNNMLNGIRATRGIPTGDMTYRYYQTSGEIVYTPYNSATTQVLTFAATATSGDIIGIALDLDNSTISWYKNNTLLYTATSIVADEYTPCVGNAAAMTGAFINFGQRPFAYTSPSGFKALCTQNLPTPTIGATSANQADKYFGVNRWAGNGSSQSITNGGFQPDWVWTKTTNTAQDSRLVDAVRGVSKAIYSQLSNAETTESTGITAFNSNGFSVGSGSSNSNAASYVGWQWKANGSGSTNTSGSITSTVSASTTSGFSIVTYTGTGANATVGHGLGAVPTLIFGRSRSTSGGWPVYSAFIPSPTNSYLELQNSNGYGSASNYWGTSAPTSTTFSLSTYGGNNDLNGTFVMYCFTPIAGFSAFGSYTGNGSTDGPFVFCGFRPRFVMMKRYDTGGTNWQMYDTSANPYNVTGNYQTANLSNAEEYYPTMDILSNGFKLRNTDGGINGSANTYIFAAFAENPFKYSLAR